MATSGGRTWAACLTGGYGLAALVLGVLGALKGSWISLAAGGGAGVLLLLCAFAMKRWPVPALIGAILVSLALIGRFAPSLLQHRYDLAAYLPMLSGVRDAVLIAGGLLVVVVCGLQLVRRAG